MFSASRPSIFPQCGNCAIASSRIKSEQEKSKIKYGDLDDHTIVITCEGTFKDFKVMWATHTGMRYPKERVNGFKVDGGMISGGEDVNCPGLK